MFDINVKNVKKGRSFFYIFLVIGLFFLFIIVGIFIFSIIKFNSLDSSVLSTSVEVQSHINDEGSVMYSPVYYYEVDSQNYSCASSASSSVKPSTQNNTVYYDSKDPSNCMTEYSRSGNFIILLFLIIPVIFILIAVINIRKINKRIKAIMQLNQKGKLIKNLPYRLEDTAMSVNNIPIQRPVVDYTLPSGSTITLYGDPRHDKKSYDADGMVDLLIDEDNPNSYYIDFEINRLTGNLPQDYYQQNNEIDSINQYGQEQYIFNQNQVYESDKNNN